MLSQKPTKRGVDIQANWESGNGWQWIENGEKFLWVTEKDGWRHIVRNEDGKTRQQRRLRRYYPLAVDEAATCIRHLQITLPKSVLVSH
jgi:hypothetical protein